RRHACRVPRQAEGRAEDHAARLVSGRERRGPVRLILRGCQAMIVTLSAERAEAVLGQLAELLIDAVDSGASVGFMPPLGETEARRYWRGVIQAIREGSRVLLAAFEGQVVQGSVQLALEMRANGSHRAEAMKLFVHRRARRQGLAKALMAELEATAIRLN